VARKQVSRIVATSSSWPAWSATIRRWIDLGCIAVLLTEEEALDPACEERRAPPGRRALVISGDALTDIDLTDCCARHRATGRRSPSPWRASPTCRSEFGIVITDRRPDRALPGEAGWGRLNDTINTASTCWSEVLDLIRRGVLRTSPRISSRSSGPGFPVRVRHHRTGRTSGTSSVPQRHRACWTQGGSGDRGFRAARRRVVGDGRRFTRRPGPRSRLRGPHSRIEGGATLRDYTVLGGSDGEVRAFLHRAVIHDYVYVPITSLELRGRENTDGVRARVEEGRRSRRVHIGEGA